MELFEHHYFIFPTPNAEILQRVRNIDRVKNYGV